MILKELIALKESSSSYFATGDAEDFGDFFSVLVMSMDTDRRQDGDEDEYFGVNVLFHRNGEITASTADSRADKEWKRDRDEIIAVARKRFGKQIDKFIQDEPWMN